MTDWPKHIRRLGRERSEGVCECCGVRRAIHAHHRERRSLGNHRIENLLDVCGYCHDTIHSQPALSQREGWIVVAPDTPLDKGVRYRGAWVLLDGHGNLIW